MGNRFYTIMQLDGTFLFEPLKINGYVKMEDGYIVLKDTDGVHILDENRKEIAFCENAVQCKINNGVIEFVMEDENGRQCVYKEIT